MKDPRQRMLEALQCLYLVVPEEVADDVKARFFAVGKFLVEEMKERCAVVATEFAVVSADTTIQDAIRSLDVWREGS